ncbi:MAG: efflux RND transporter periplasmic adaptor subunit [Myxococcota bacterium]
MHSVLITWAALAGLAAPSSAAPVRVAQVTGRAISPTLPVAGTIHSRNNQRITAGVDGQVRSVAEPGRRVKQEIIAQLDDTPQTLQLKEQQAEVARAAARLKFLDTQLRRQSKLRKTNHITDFDLEQAQLDRTVAASELGIAKARVKQTQDRIARATIRAEFDGVVVERLQRRGEEVTRGTVLGRIADAKTLEVRALVPVKYGARLQPGAELSVFGFEQRFMGRIHSVIPTNNLRAQTVELRVDVPASARNSLTLGQLMTVAVPIVRKAAVKTAIAVPRDALILRQAGAYVFRILGDDTAERVAVQIGDGEGEWVAVRGTLSIGDRVAIRGAETLKDGQKVTVMNSAETSSKHSDPSL